MPWTLYELCLCGLCIWTLYVTFIYTLNEVFFPSSKVDKHASNTAMATRKNITQIANFDIHDESNLAQRWKKWKQSF